MQEAKPASKYVVLWWRGTWAGDLLNFETALERDAFYAGHPGPFWRIVKPDPPARIAPGDLKQEIAPKPRG